MKKTLLLFLCIPMHTLLSAQIITPEIKARFGTDADLHSNYFNGASLAGNDDWFSQGLAGTGVSVIDTTGAASILDGYITTPANRYKTIIRNMSYPAFTEVNNVLLMDAVFVRDFHADDSTIFASGSNKNGQNPGSWTSPSAQSVPAKNEILDVFMHVRRHGLTATDSLWMFGAVSIENTTGNRYFDFEMYQSDITFDYATRSFTGYGPEDGHTAWQFDAAGNITKAGDIILTAEYGSSSLTMIEARIWINKNLLSTTPANFSWSGEFDGANSGAQYGYASIVPKNSGDYYSGLQSNASTSAGPFKLIRSDNSIVTDYTARQFMEFSVNLTKLGLDPVTILGGSTCDKPFQKVLVKTRASTSFTAELKDFVAPFEFFKAPKAKLFTTIPLFCGVNGVSNIVITNPVSTSVYTWSTIGGRFADSTDKTSVFVDRPGTYIVNQKLRTVCPLYATDTLKILFDSTCGVLIKDQLNFTGRISSGKALLSWQVNSAENTDHFVIESSTDGIYFSAMQKIYPAGLKQLSVTDNIEKAKGQYIYYRLKTISTTNRQKYSAVIRLPVAEANPNAISIYPNPAKDIFYLGVSNSTAANLKIEILDEAGKLMRSVNSTVMAGTASLPFSNINGWHKGIYTIKILKQQEMIIKRIVLGN